MCSKRVRTQTSSPSKFGVKPVMNPRLLLLLLRLNSCSSSSLIVLPLLRESADAEEDLMRAVDCESGVEKGVRSVGKNSNSNRAYSSRQSLQKQITYK